MVLGDSIPRAVHRLYPSRVEDRQTAQPTQEPIVLDSSTERIPQVVIPDIVSQPQEPIVIVNSPPAVVQESAAASKIRTHVVKSGEILPVIARMYYGEEQGNRRVVIQKLYEANTSVLKSPDKVCVGDKLMIPTLEELLNPSAVAVKAPKPSQGVLEKITDLFKPVDKKEAASISEYMVQEGDSLWSIAQQKLGNGNRYKEIIKLNKSAIKNASDIAVGTRLKIPIQ
jgi:nucleoid-associated protein YgaU